MQKKGVERKNRPNNEYNISNWNRTNLHLLRRIRSHILKREEKCSGTNYLSYWRAKRPASKVWKNRITYKKVIFAQSWYLSSDRYQTAAKEIPSITRGDFCMSDLNIKI